MNHRQEVEEIFELDAPPAPCPVPEPPEPDPDAYYAARERQFWENYDTEQDEREAQAFWEANGFEAPPAPCPPPEPPAADDDTKPIIIPPKPSRARRTFELYATLARQRNAARREAIDAIHALYLDGMIEPVNPNRAYEEWRLTDAGRAALMEDES